MENNLRIKEINAEERVTFQNKGNLRDVYKEKDDKKRQVNCMIRNRNFVRGYFPKRMRKGSREVIVEICSSLEGSSQFYCH